MSKKLKKLNNDIEKCYINCCYTGDKVLKIYLEFALDRLQQLLKRDGDHAKKHNPTSSNKRRAPNILINNLLMR